MIKLNKKVMFLCVCYLAHYSLAMEISIEKGAHPAFAHATCYTEHQYLDNELISSRLIIEHPNNAIDIFSTSFPLRPGLTTPREHTMTSRLRILNRAKKIYAEEKEQEIKAKEQQMAEERARKLSETVFTIKLRPTPPLHSRSERARQRRLGLMEEQKHDKDDHPSDNPSLLHNNPVELQTLYQPPHKRGTTHPTIYGPHNRYASPTPTLAPINQHLLDSPDSPDVSPSPVAFILDPTQTCNTANPPSPQPAYIGIDINEPEMNPFDPDFDFEAYTKK